MENHTSATVNGDFIVNTELHDFDDFKSKELESGYNCLEVNKLFQHYYFETKLHGNFTLNKYGLKFLHLRASEIDDLCEWVEELKEYWKPYLYYRCDNYTGIVYIHRTYSYSPKGIESM